MQNPKTNNIRKFLLDYIAEHKLEAGQKIPSIRVISELTGNSMLTVHRVITSMVSEGTLISKRCSGIYIAPQNNKLSNIIGVFFSLKSETNLYLSNLRKELHKCILNAGKLPISIYYDPTIPLNLKELNLGGIIVYNDGDFFNKVNSTLKELDIPMVCINDMADNVDINTVSTDNLAAGRLISRYFIEKGHSDFMILPAPHKGSSVYERISGFLMEMKFQGIPESNCFIFGDDEYNKMDSMEKIKSFARNAAEYLAKNKNITAVFAINDWMAFLLAQELTAMSLKIPEDISLIGFDNQIFSETMEPALTTVQHPIIEIAQEAVKILLEYHHNNKIQRKRTINFNPDLIERSSVLDLKTKNQTLV